MRESGAFREVRKKQETGSRIVAAVTTGDAGGQGHALTSPAPGSRRRSFRLKAA